MSIVQQTLSSMRSLNLNPMADAYDLQLQQPKLHKLPFDDRLSLLFEAETSARNTKKLENMIKGAKFPEKASLEDFDSSAPRGIDKNLIASLATCEWVRQNLNLIIVGPTGVGKTWLASAFGSQACRHRLPTLYYRASSLYTDISTAIKEGSLSNLKSKIRKPSLLIIDDFGIRTMTAEVSEVLYEIMDDRYRDHSLLITSQFPTDIWHSHFPDPTLADAVLDRIVHKAHRITLKGESMRKLQAKRRMRDG